jgi:Zn-finger nucleic acid-binding protein
MNCPSCQTVMREREQGTVIIDICPNCRGVWLDAGELEKLGERERRYYDDDDDDDYDDDRPRRSSSSDRRSRLEDSRSRPPQRKKGFLSSMFENFGEGGD